MTYSAAAYPFDTVCYVTDLFAQGSGVMISPDCVLTAAHVVLNNSQPVDASTIRVSPGYSNGASSYGTQTVLAYNYFTINDNGDLISSSDSQYDFAVLHLSQKLTTGYMGIQSNFAGGSVNVTGYPGNYAGTQVDQPETVVRNPNYSLLNMVALSPGSSGGPLWIGGSTNPQVVGIVSSGSGNGTLGYAGLITTSIYNQIQAWVAAFDSVPITTNSVYRFLDTTFGTHFFTASASERDTIKATRPDLVQEINSFGTATAGSQSAETVYRFLDTVHGTHFFTASQTEYNNVLNTRKDLTLEASASFLEHGTQQAGDVAVYRFFDTKFGTHFYTGDANEEKGIVTPGSSTYRPDLTYEGIGFYAPSGTYL